MIAHDADGVGFHAVFTPVSSKLLQDGGEVCGIASATLRSPPVRAPAMMKVPASMRSGMMRCFAPWSLLTPLHADRGRAGALDFGAHGVEQLGQVGDFGFAGAILHDGLALGERGGHEQVFGASDRDFVEDNLRALEPIG